MYNLNIIRSAKSFSFNFFNKNKTTPSCNTHDTVPSEQISSEISNKYVVTDLYQTRTSTLSERKKEKLHVRHKHMVYKYQCWLKKK